MSVETHRQLAGQKVCYQIKNYKKIKILPHILSSAQSVIN